MKRLILGITLVMFSAGAALCSDTISLPAKNGNVTSPTKSIWRSSRKRDALLAMRRKKVGKLPVSARTGLTRPAKGAMKPWQRDRQSAVIAIRSERMPDKA